jgi:hypothetical protein
MNGRSKPFKVEEVDGVETPPRARVEDAETPTERLERKKDYLEGFLAQKPQDRDPDRARRRALRKTSSTRCDGIFDPRSRSTSTTSG